MSEDQPQALVLVASEFRPRSAKVEEKWVTEPIQEGVLGKEAADKSFFLATVGNF